MCCNGVLFGDVELQARDDSRRLTALGMELFRKGRKQCFNQPCACFDGKWCRIYDDRPNRCGAFECRLLQRVQAGKATSAVALKAIADARHCADRVRALVRQLGENDERMPLSRRYSAIMSQPLDLAGGDDETVECRSELMLAVHKLTRILEREFL
jgi:Fe-S-cluster containining protein